MDEDESGDADEQASERRATDAGQESFRWLDAEDAGSGDAPGQQSPESAEGRRERLWHTGPTEETDSGGPAGQQSPDSDGNRPERLWHTGPTEDAESGETASQQNAESEGSDQGARERGTGQTDGAGAPRTDDRNGPGTDQQPSAASSFDELIERSGGATGATQSGRSDGRAGETGTTSDEVSALFEDLNAFDRAMAGSQILVLSPTNHSITDSICSEFVTVGGAAGRDVMTVTTTQPPERRLELIRDTPEWSGGRVAIIEVGDLGTTDSIDGDRLVHKRISNPKMLQKLGLVVTQTLKEWSNGDRPATLCFHTISEISHHVQDQTLFQFLYTLQAKLNSMGVTAHYHMDPAEHDDQDPDTFKSMFDFVLRVSQDGSIEVE